MRGGRTRREARAHAVVVRRRAVGRRAELRGRVEDRQSGPDRAVGSDGEGVAVAEDGVGRGRRGRDPHAIDEPRIPVTAARPRADTTAMRCWGLTRQKRPCGRAATTWCIAGNLWVAMCEAHATANEGRRLQRMGAGRSRRRAAQ